MLFYPILGFNYNFLWYCFFRQIYIIITYYVIFFRFTFFFLTKRGAVLRRLHPFFAVSAPKNSVLFLLFFLKKSCHCGTLFWHYDFVIFSHCIDVFRSGGLRSRTLDHPSSSWKLFCIHFHFRRCSAFEHKKRRYPMGEATPFFE